MRMLMRWPVLAGSCRICGPVARWWPGSCAAFMSRESWRRHRTAFRFSVRRDCTPNLGIHLLCDFGYRAPLLRSLTSRAGSSTLVESGPERRANVAQNKGAPCDEHLSHSVPPRMRIRRCYASGIGR